MKNADTKEIDIRGKIPSGHRLDGCGEIEKMGDEKLPAKVAKLLSKAREKIKKAVISDTPEQLYKEAAELIKEATSLAPDSDEVWIAYAMALLCLEDRAKAWNVYQKGLKLGKGKTHSLNFVSRAQAVQFAKMHEENGKLDFAEEQLNLLTDHSPKFPGGWLELARFYIRQERFDEAEFTIAHGLHETEDEFLYLALAQVQALNGRMDQAIIATKEALALKPDFFEALMYQALFANRLKLKEEEKSALSKAKKYLGKHPELKPTYESMLEFITNSKLLVFWQKETRDIKRTEEKEEAPEESPDADVPITEEESMEEEIETLASSDRVASDSEISLRDAVSRQPKSADAWFRLGDYLRTQQKYGEAEECFKKAIDIDKSHSEAFRSLGIVYISTDRIDEGERAFRRAVFLNPSSSDAWLELAKYQFESGDISVALQSAHKCVNADSDNFDAWALLAKIHLKSNQIREAEYAARKAIDLKISFSDGWKILGEILDRRGEKNKAIEAFKNVIEIETDYSMGWSNLGVAYVKSKRYDEALKSFQKAIELDSENIIAWKNLSTLYRELDRRKDADDAYEKYLALHTKKS